MRQIGKAIDGEEELQAKYRYQNHSRSDGFSEKFLSDFIRFSLRKMIIRKTLKEDKTAKGIKVGVKHFISGTRRALYFCPMSWSHFGCLLGLYNDKRWIVRKKFSSLFLMYRYPKSFTNRQSFYKS